MKLFDKKAERTVLISLSLYIPFLIFILKKENGKIGVTEIGIIIITLLIGIGLMYLVKWYANRN